MSNKKKRQQSSNVIRLSRTARFNSAIIIFVIILIYVIASVIRSLSKEPITTYKVSSSNINNNIKCTGIALRSENEVTSSKSGYLLYFVKDGDKVKKGTPVCTVDETGNIITSIKAAGESDEGNELFTDSDYTSIKNSINTYKASYSDVNFSNLYNFKSDIESKVMELSSQVMMKQISSGGAKVSSTLENIKASNSGVITYYCDGYEKKTPETLSEDDFNISNYKKTALKTGDILDSGSVVYKMIADENWHVVCQITNEQLKQLEGETKVRFTLNGSPNEMSATFALIPKGDSTFLDIPLNKYMVDYVDERFLKVEIILNKFEGLKVPNSALVEFETYKIPKKYIQEDDSSSIKSVNVQRFDKNATDTNASSGNFKNQKVELVVYKTDEDYYYVNKDSFYDTDIIVVKGSSKTVPIMSLERSILDGVYLANAGIADFTEVEIIKSQDEFTILNSDGHLKEFDNVVLDSSQVFENQTLY